MNSKEISNNRKALLLILNYLQEAHSGVDRVVPLPDNLGNAVWVECDKFDIVLTIVKAYQDKECVKIEELRVDEKYRGQGIGTELLIAIKYICDLTNAKVGFWVDINNNRLLDFYTRNGFILKETVRDHWLEYN